MNATVEKHLKLLRKSQFEIFYDNSNLHMKNKKHWVPGYEYLEELLRRGIQ